MSSATRTKVGGKPQGRTQEERRRSTRAALLDATVACLSEYGYADTTTTKVVERAGVSRGAQVHHFPTKAGLVAEAVGHLAALRAEALREHVERLPDGPDRVQQALDLLWEVHAGPLFQASLELWVAARTDAELRAALVPVERQVIARIAEFAPELFGAYAEQESFPANLQTALSTIQGMAMLSEVLATSKRDLGDLWTATRDRLALLFEAP